MLAFLQQPFAFSLALAVLTSVFVYLYSKTTERDGEVMQNGARKALFKTLAAGLLAGMLLAYLTTRSSSHPVPVAQPFDAAPGIEMSGI